MDIDEKGNVIPGEVYVKKKGMRENKKCGTDVEINALVIMCKINVFVYYKQKWLKHGSWPEGEAMYMQNIHSHFEPAIAP